MAYRISVARCCERLMLDAFFDAAAFAQGALDAPEVGAAWRDESVLPQMSVGALAGHLYLALRRLDRILDEPAPDAAATTPMAGLYRDLMIETPEDLEAPLHRAIRADGQHIAERGWESVRAAYDARLAALAEKLPACPANRRILLPSSTTELSDYLRSRVVELVVHADDLTTSVHLPEREPPPSCAGVAVHFLLDVAAEHRGTLPLIRALARTGHAASEIRAL
jgi:hypothetical protein